MSPADDPSWYQDIHTNVTTGMPPSLTAFLHARYYPAAERSLRLNRTGRGVQVTSLILIVLVALRAVYNMRQEARVTHDFPLDSAAFGSGVVWVIVGYVFFAFGSHLRASARHYRASLISGIMGSPHLSPEEAMDLVNRLGLNA